MSSYIAYIRKKLQVGENLTLNPFTTEARFYVPFLCAECYGIQHIKTGFSGERVKLQNLINTIFTHLNFVSRYSDPQLQLQGFPQEKTKAGDFWKVRCQCCEPVMPEARGSGGSAPMKFF